MTRDPGMRERCSPGEGMAFRHGSRGANLDFDKRKQDGGESSTVLLMNHSLLRERGYAYRRSVLVTSCIPPPVAGTMSNWRSIERLLRQFG